MLGRRASLFYKLLLIKLSFVPPFFMCNLLPFLFFHLRDVDKIDDMMQDITEQQDVAREISEAISGPFGEQFDEVFFLAHSILNIPFTYFVSCANLFIFFNLRMSCLRSWRSWSSRSWRTTWRVWADCPAFPAPNCLQPDPASAQVSPKQSTVMKLDSSSNYLQC